MSLTDRGVEIFDILAQRDGGEQGLIFKRLRDRMLSENTFDVIVKKLGYTATAHGMRSTFRD